MARGKKHTEEQIVSLLRQIGVAVANGKVTARASKEVPITSRSTTAGEKSMADGG
jgi:hypothetical protein